MSVLIIGGTSGLGLELAKTYAKNDTNVYVTGRRDVDEASIHSLKLDLTSKSLREDIVSIIDNVGDIDMLVFCAGYYQEGSTSDLEYSEIDEMIQVGATAPVYTLKAVLDRQDKLDTFVMVTSTSAWTPRELEPVYNLVKAGEAHFANGVAEDPKVSKVLVAGPAGMATNFWEGQGRDMSEMNDPADVARAIDENIQDDYSFRSVRILREPFRVEKVDER